MVIINFFLRGQVSHHVVVEKCVEVKTIYTREDFVGSGKSSLDLSSNEDQGWLFSFIF